MQVILPVEIDCGTRYCGACSLYNHAYARQCVAFSLGRTWHAKQGDFERLPECLDAVKKEKERREKCRAKRKANSEYADAADNETFKLHEELARRKKGAIQK